jgi:long-chain acyl-CoA synthetase
MDISAYLEVKPAPCAVFDRLATNDCAEQPRFFVRDEAGSWQPVTWGSYAERIRRAALFLADHGLGRGDVAAVFASNSIEWAAVALAIQATGATMVPIYPSSTADQASYVVSHSDAKLVFADAACRAKLAGGSARVIDLDNPELWSHADDAQRFESMLAAVELNDIGLMLYTSGTSGRPKGVPLSHENVGVNARDWLLALEPALHEQAVDVLWLPLSHIFGFGELCLGNTLGFTSYMSSPAEALAALPEVAPTVFMSVPAYWEKLAKGGSVEHIRRATGGKLSFCLSGGAGLDRKVKELFEQAGALIIEGYGLTECAPTLTLNRPGDYNFDSVGKPLTSVELRLADDGEILARGPNVFTGFHKDPEATAAAFTEDGWFQTGDLGELTDDGFVRIVGRKKDILVTAGGKNVAPANIEMRFADSPLFEHVLVYGDGKRYLVAGLWLSAAEVEGLGAAELDERIRAAIENVNGQLARFETIKKFCIIGSPLTVEDGHLTASLKVRRKAVYEAFKGQFEALYG